MESFFFEEVVSCRGSRCSYLGRRIYGTTVSRMGGFTRTAPPRAQASSAAAADRGSSPRENNKLRAGGGQAPRRTAAAVPEVIGTMAASREKKKDYCRRPEKSRNGCLTFFSVSLSRVSELMPRRTTKKRMRKSAENWFVRTDYFLDNGA